MTPAEEMRKLLLETMEVASNNDWGPNPFVCRWCRCWLRYGDTFKPVPKVEHKPDCPAARLLGQPSKATP